MHNILKYDKYVKFSQNYFFIKTLVVARISNCPTSLKI